MKKRLILPLLLPLACAACAERQPPQPDLAKLDALAASMDEAAAEAGKTERLLASVEKIPPERINPNLAIAVVTK